MTRWQFSEMLWVFVLDSNSFRNQCIAAQVWYVMGKNVFVTQINYKSILLFEMSYKKAKLIDVSLIFTKVNLNCLEVRSSLIFWFCKYRIFRCIKRFVVVYKSCYKCKGKFRSQFCGIRVDRSYKRILKLMVGSTSLD